MAVLAVAIGGAVVIGAATGYVLSRWRGRTAGASSRHDLVVNVAFGGLIGFALVMVVPRMASTIRPPVWHEGVTQIVSDAQLNDVIQRANGRPVLVYFYAPWCVPCRAMAPNVDKLVEAGRTVLTVNVDETARLAELYNVRSVPTIYIFRDGEIGYSGLGYHSLHTLLKLTQ